MKTLLSPRDIASQDGSAFSASTYLVSLRRKLGFVCLFCTGPWYCANPCVVQNRLKISHSNVDILKFQSVTQKFLTPKAVWKEGQLTFSNRLRFGGCSIISLTVRSCWYHSANRKGKILRRIHTVWASPATDSDMSLLLTSHQLWVRQCGTKLTKIVVLKHRLLGLLEEEIRLWVSTATQYFGQPIAIFVLSPIYREEHSFTPNRGRPSYHLVTVSGSKSGPQVIASPTYQLHMCLFLQR